MYNVILQLQMAAGDIERRRKQEHAEMEAEIQSRNKPKNKKNMQVRMPCLHIIHVCITVTLYRQDTGSVDVIICTGFINQTHIEVPPSLPPKIQSCESCCIGFGCFGDLHRFNITSVLPHRFHKSNTKKTSLLCCPQPPPPPQKKNPIIQKLLGLVVLWILHSFNITSVLPWFERRRYPISEIVAARHRLEPWILCSERQELNTYTTATPKLQKNRKACCYK